MIYTPVKIFSLSLFIISINFVNFFVSKNNKDCTNERWKKRTVEPSSPSDSFFDFKGDPFTKELADTFTSHGNPATNNLNRQNFSANHPIAKTNLEKEEKQSKTRVYKPRKVGDWDDFHHVFLFLYLMLLLPTKRNHLRIAIKNGQNRSANIWKRCDW